MLIYICGDGNCVALLRCLGAITNVVEAGNTYIVVKNYP